MKKIFVGLFALALIYVGVGTVFGASSQSVRVAGVNTASGSIFHLIGDSTDTFWVDTCFSDTVNIDATKKFLDYLIVRPVITFTDSANDSMVIATTVFSYSEGGFAYPIASHTGLGANNADVVADTVLAHLYIGDVYGFNRDSVIWDKIYFQTVFSDSVIQDKDVDTTPVSVQIYLLQR